MVRSIGAARGAVLVAAGAEKVRLPRLPELPDTRASTVTTVNTSAATTARSASNGRWMRSMVFPRGLSFGLDGPAQPLNGSYIGTRQCPVKGRCIVPQA